MEKELFRDDRASLPVRRDDAEVVLDVRNVSKTFPILRGVLQRRVGTVSAVSDVSFALRRRHPEYKVLAMDFCHPMLALGQKKLARRAKG